MLKYLKMFFPQVSNKSVKHDARRFWKCGSPPARELKTALRSETPPFAQQEETHAAAQEQTVTLLERRHHQAQRETKC